MATWLYPTSDFDRAERLLAVLGSFWARTYQGRDQLKDFASARAQLESQTYQDYLEAADALARGTVPIFHRDLWYLLMLRESERNDSQTSLLHYDELPDDADPPVYDSTYQYDTPRVRTGHAFPVPADLKAAPLIFNRMTSPSRTLTYNIDFTLDDDDSAIVFVNNPFEDDLVSKRQVFEDGVQVDQEAALWVFRGGFDWEHAWMHYGYILGIKLKSSSAYRQFIDAMFDAIVGGTAREQLELAFAAITGIPLVRENEETIIDIAEDQQHKLVITDQHAYQYPLDATVAVTIGDTVLAGDRLVDALEVIEFNRGQTGDLPGLVLGKGFLNAGFYGELVFEDTNVQLEVITDDPSGYTKVKFGLGGFPLDVEKFFDDLHANGVATGETLAHLLDTRTVKETEPVASNLPSSINPLGFLVANVLRNNAFVVRVKIASLPAGNLGIHQFRLLRKLIPPHTAMIVLMEVSPKSDSVRASQIVESLSTGIALETLADTLSSNYVHDNKLSVRAVSGTCQ